MKNQWGAITVGDGGLVFWFTLRIRPRLTPIVASTGFDITRRDSLGVVMRDIPTLLRQTIEWIQSDPFKSM